jgi:hypothetical protein
MLPACRVRSLDRVGPLVILPEAARHVLGLPPTRPRARAAFNPASVRLRMTLCSNSAFCSPPQNADMRRPRLCGVVNGIRGRTVLVCRILGATVSSSASNESFSSFYWVYSNYSSSVIWVSGCARHILRNIYLRFMNVVKGSVRVAFCRANKVLPRAPKRNRLGIRRC